MPRKVWTIAAMLLFSVCAAPAQSLPPSADTTEAARSLVETMKLVDQFKSLLPIIIQALRPALTQDRPEVAADFDAMMPELLEAFAPYYSEMVDGMVAVYATHFTAEELQDIELFYRTPVGQRMLEKSQVVMQQSMQIGQAIGRKAAEDLRNLATEELRKKGHKL